MKKNKSQPKIPLSVAIIVAGVLIMIGIIIAGSFIKTNNAENKEPEDFSGELSADEEEQEYISYLLSVLKTELPECSEALDIYTFWGNVKENWSFTTSTPYSVIVGKNGVKTEMRGAQPPEKIRELINQVKEGEVDNPYTGDIVAKEENDRILGNPDAPVKIISFSDLNCSYCAMLHGYLTDIVLESEGEVALIFRHCPILGEDSLIKAIKSECAYLESGLEGYWDFIDFMFE